MKVLGLTREILKDSKRLRLNIGFDVIAKATLNDLDFIIRRFVRSKNGIVKLIGVEYNEQAKVREDALKAALADEFEMFEGFDRRLAVLGKGSSEGKNFDIDVDFSHEEDSKIYFDDEKRLGYSDDFKTTLEAILKSPLAIILKDIIKGTPKTLKSFNSLENTCQLYLVEVEEKSGRVMLNFDFYINRTPVILITIKK